LLLSRVARSVWDLCWQTEYKHCHPKGYKHNFNMVRCSFLEARCQEAYLITVLVHDIHLWNSAQAVRLKTNKVQSKFK